MNVKKEFEKFVKQPKPKLSTVPRSDDYIVQFFTTRRELKGGLVLNHSLLEKVDKTYETSTYPLAIILAAGEGCTYEEGDIVYFTDEIFDTQDNPDWVAWSNKAENRYPKPQEPEPPRNIGGLSNFEQFKFRKDKFGTEDEDLALFQIPQRLVRGKYIYEAKN